MIHFSFSNFTYNESLSSTKGKRKEKYASKFSCLDVHFVSSHSITIRVSPIELNLSWFLKLSNLQISLEQLRIYRICLYKQLSLMLLNYEKYKPRSCLSDLFVINEYFRLVYINQES